VINQNCNWAVNVYQGRRWIDTVYLPTEESARANFQTRQLQPGEEATLMQESWPHHWIERGRRQNQPAQINRRKSAGEADGLAATILALIGIVLVYILFFWGCMGGDVCNLSAKNLTPRQIKQCMEESP
jgi:hypothetical protein